MVRHTNSKTLTPKQRVEAIRAAEKTRAEKLHAKRLAALDDTDHHVLALIGINPGMFTRVRVNTWAGRPIYSWRLDGVSVDRSIRRLRVLKWITTNLNEKLELRRARKSN